MRLFDLAKKNIRSKSRAYILYLASMSFSVMVYYSFAAMSVDKHLVNKSIADQRIGSALKSSLIIIILFIIVFMITANNFFMKQRRKEMGLYQILGMRKLQIGLLFFFENFVIGLASLGIGLLMGILFSKLFSMVLIKSMNLEIAGGILFSPIAILRTCLIFLTILVLVSMKNVRTVYKNKLVGLFHGEKSKNRYKKIGFFTWFFGILGVLLLISGYLIANNFFQLVFMIQDDNQAVFFMIGVPIYILSACVLGTYLFFHNFIRIILEIFENISSIYYSNLAMISISNMKVHLRKNATTLATIATLCGTALTYIGTSAAAYSYGITQVEMAAPTAYTVSSNLYPKVEKVITGMEVAHDIEEVSTLKLKVAGVTVNSNIFGDSNSLVSVISESNYNQAKRGKKKLRTIHLKQWNHFVELTNLPRAFTKIKNISTDETVQIMDQHPIEIKRSDTQQNFLFDSEFLGFSNSVFVVSDALYTHLNGANAFSLTQFNITDENHSRDLVKKITDTISNQQVSLVSTLQIKDKQVVGNIQSGTKNELNTVKGTVYTRSSYRIRYPTLRSMQSSSGILVYISLFLGIVFMIATATIIMLKQLSEAEEERETYQVLRKLGVSNKIIKRSISQQMLVIFFAPMVIAVLDAVFALKLLTMLYPTISYMLVYLSCGLLLVLYTLYYFVTVRMYVSIIEKN
ncbi:FtsX-like permease family protein [Vagococcus entomophilus]|nr:ABC transporter permease [Vagococcus entomophilus]